MPKYFAGKATLLNPGEQFLAFNAETVTAPQLSAAVCLGPSTGQNPPGISVEVTFGGAPGAFSMQVQEASTDLQNNYITPTNAAYTTTAVTANNVARTDLVPTGGQFIAILLSALTNAVAVTVKITRIS